MTAFFAVLLIGAVFVSTRRMTGTPARSQWREQAEKDVRAMLGEETPQELRELEAAERYTHNRHKAAAAFWAGSETYVDFDGHERRL